MTYLIEYFHAKVQATVEDWPVDVVADYARIVELLIEHGPTYVYPTHAPLVVDCLNYARAANLALGERSTVFLSDSAWSYCMLLLKNHRKHQRRKPRLRASE